MKGDALASGEAKASFFAPRVPQDKWDSIWADDGGASVPDATGYAYADIRHGIHTGHKIVAKEWGHEIWWVNNELYCGKELFVKAHYQCSLHRHIQKHETFIIQSGKCLLEIGGFKREMRKGDVQVIPPLTQHRFSNPFQRPCVITEISTHHDDADVERFEPSGRINADNG